MPIHESIQQLKPKLFRTNFNPVEYAEVMSMFDALMLEKLDEENREKLTEFINNGIDTIYNRFNSGTEIHPKTLNILIRAIQVYNYNHEKPYHFRTYENEDDPNDPTVMFMNDIVRMAVQRGELFDRTRGAYTKSQLKTHHGTNMQEVDGGAKRKRTKRRHKRKQRKQRKSKRVKKVIH
jgi:hypothetical protein